MEVPFHSAVVVCDLNRFIALTLESAKSFLPVWFKDHLSLLSFASALPSFGFFWLSLGNKVFYYDFNLMAGDTLMFITRSK